MHVRKPGQPHNEYVTAERIMSTEFPRLKRILDEDNTNPDTRHIQDSRK